MVDPANEMFVQDLAKYRPTLSEDFKNGMVYFSEDALSKKLVDSLGTYADLLNQIASDLQIKQSSQMSKVTMTIPNRAVWAAKALGGEVVGETTQDTKAEAEETDTTEDPNKAPGAKAEAPASEATEENPLQAKVAELEAQLKSSQEELKTSQEEATSYKNAISAISNNPAAQRTEARQTGNDKAPKTPEAEAEVEMTMAEEYDVH